MVDRHHYNTTLLLGVIVPSIVVFFMLPTGTRAAFLSPFRRAITSSSRLFFSSSTGVSYEADGMPILPSTVVQYSQVPGPNKSFKADKIPKGLLKEHTTKAGTWGVIRVAKGRLEYTIHEPKQAVLEITKDRVGIIEPTRKHQVKALSNDLEFVVEFHREPGTGPVDEKREGL